MGTKFQASFKFSSSLFTFASASIRIPAQHVGSIKILNRQDDKVCNIAERAECLHDYAYFPIPDQMPEMVRQPSLMVRMTLDAFVDSNAELAKKVIQCDDAVDESNLLIIAELKDLIKQDSSLTEPALHCFSASRHVERIADLAENIAEDVIYLVDGDIIRHRHGVFIPENL